METKANYVLIGVFTIATAVFLLLFGLWAAKFSSDRVWQAYLVVFTEPVTGLTEGRSVQYNGIAVVTVETLDLDANDPRRVIAPLQVDPDVPVNVISSFRRFVYDFVLSFSSRFFSFFFL